MGLQSPRVLVPMAVLATAKGEVVPVVASALFAGTQYTDVPIGQCLGPYRTTKHTSELMLSSGMTLDDLRGALSECALGLALEHRHDSPTRCSHLELTALFFFARRASIHHWLELASLL